MNGAMEGGAAVGLTQRAPAGSPFVHPSFPTSLTARLRTPCAAALAAPWYTQGVYHCCELGGTRSLKEQTRADTVYRAHHAMQRGDAYVFETWGPRAAWHVGATRTSPPPGSYRTSIEVRVAAVPRLRRERCE